ncbi:pimeloyl-ACP methyl ester carboxylesterase [Methylobacterium sp. RAS18]|nr:pimeloyl-ACP methyl ester carboxylesterase [Methylobacterium sp. RAS18]
MSGTSADGTEGVLLLHGIARRAASLRPLERRLTRAGYVTLNLDYPARQLGLADIAEVIEPTVAAFGEDVTRLHIVTHSMGGLVARVLLARRRPDSLGRVVMLGPPNGGSEIADALHRFAAYRRFFGPAGAELGTERGAAQARLFGQVDYPLGIIAGSRSLYPLASLLLLPGPNDGRVTVARTRLDGMTDHIVLPAAHPTMMWNRRLAAETLHFLREGRFSGR